MEIIYEPGNHLGHAVSSRRRRNNQRQRTLRETSLSLAEAEWYGENAGMSVGILFGIYLLSGTLTPLEASTVTLFGWWRTATINSLNCRMPVEFVTGFPGVAPTQQRKICGCLINIFVYLPAPLRGLLLCVLMALVANPFSINLRHLPFTKTPVTKRIVDWRKKWKDVTENTGDLTISKLRFLSITLQVLLFEYCALCLFHLQTDVPSECFEPDCTKLFIMEHQSHNGKRPPTNGGGSSHIFLPDGVSPNYTPEAKLEIRKNCYGGTDADLREAWGLRAMPTSPILILPPEFSYDFFGLDVAPFKPKACFDIFSLALNIFLMFVMWVRTWIENILVCYVLFVVTLWDVPLMYWHLCCHQYYYAHPTNNNLVESAGEDRTDSKQSLISDAGDDVEPPTEEPPTSVTTPVY